jgi:RimJ/RimL family protein N-acetyltransferase
MICVNEPAGEAAPRFFLGRTTQGNEWRFRHDLDEELVRDLEAACVNEPAGDEFLLQPYGSTRYETLLARTAPIQNVWTGPAYRFPEMIAAASEAVLITGDNAGLLQPYFTDWLDSVAIGRPFFAVVNGGHAVSLCCSVRETPRAHEAGVETHPEFGRRGYAARAVTAWVRAVRDIGRIPLYSTSWQNVASQAVAAKLGLVRYGTDLHIT